MQLLLRDRSSGGRRGIQRTGSDPDKGGPKSRSRHGNNHWEIPAFFDNFFVLSFWHNVLAITSFDIYKMAKNVSLYFEGRIRACVRACLLACVRACVCAVFFVCCVCVCVARQVGLETRYFPLTVLREMTEEAPILR